MKNIIDHSFLKIHHIGIVVRDIQEYATSQYSFEGEVVYDPAQHSYICMLATGEKEPPLELIEPIDERSTTCQFMQKQGYGIHHLCYEVRDLDTLEKYLFEHKLKRITQPVEAVVFANKLVVFTYSRQSGIVEFLIQAE